MAIPSAPVRALVSLPEISKSDLEAPTRNTTSQPIRRGSRTETVRPNLQYPYAVEVVINVGAD
jgi:hypothetical protein